MYVPMIGLSVAVAWGLAELVAARRGFRPWVAAAGLAAVGGMAYGSWIQIGYWEDTDTLFAGARVDGNSVVIVARRGGPDFLDSEIARLGHLAGLAASIARN